MLTSVGYLQALYGPSDATPPSQLSALLVAAESIIKDFCKQNIEVATYTEFYSSTNLRYFVLREKPVISITSLWSNDGAYYGTSPRDAFDDNSLLTQGVDYCLDVDRGGLISTSGKVLRVTTNWTQYAMAYVPGHITMDLGPAYGNIKVIYTAGYSVIPDDLQYCCAFLVSYMKRTIKFGQNLQAEKLGDYGYHVARAAIKADPEMATTRQILSRYRDFSI